MGLSSKIEIMISSRCEPRFPAESERTLTDIRRELKKSIQALEPFGKPLFKVWINEDEPPKGGDANSWDHCLKAARDCDMLIVIYDGYAGWEKVRGGIGICHAELMEGLNKASAKVRLIALDSSKVAKAKESKRDQLFQAYAKRHDLFRGATVSSEGELETRVMAALQEAFVSLTQHGVRESGRGRFDLGDALDWSRLDFSNRQKSMVKVVNETLEAMPKAIRLDGSVVVTLGSQKVGIIPSAVPAAFTLAAAREMVGQPFLRDHEHASNLDKQKAVGPVHMIACQKTITEAQAIRLLGFPDATVVSTPFGIYLADDVQKIQIILVANCRDETSTRHSVQRVFEWLDQSGEDEFLSERAQARLNIVRVIAQENRPKTSLTRPN